RRKRWHQNYLSALRCQSRRYSIEHRRSCHRGHLRGEMMPRHRKRTIVVGLALALLPVQFTATAQVQFCGQFRFPKKTESDLTRTVERAIAKVYASPKD